MTAALDGGLVHRFVSARFVEPDVDSLFDDADPATGGVATRALNYGVRKGLRVVAVVVLCRVCRGGGAASLQFYTERTNMCVQL